MNGPPDQTGGFRLHRKAGSISQPVDSPSLSQGKGWKEGFSRDSCVYQQMGFKPFYRRDDKRDHSRSVCPYSPPCNRAFVPIARPHHARRDAAAGICVFNDWGLASDPVAHLAHSSKAHRQAAGRLCALADRRCQGRLLALGGGGYNLEDLAEAGCEVLTAMPEAEGARESGA